jgi:hypothetical protein
MMQSLIKSPTQSVSDTVYLPLAIRHKHRLQAKINRMKLNSSVLKERRYYKIHANINCLLCKFVHVFPVSRVFFILTALFVYIMAPM